MTRLEVRIAVHAKPWHIGWQVCGTFGGEQSHSLLLLQPKRDLHGRVFALHYPAGRPNPTGPKLTSIVAFSPWTDLTNSGPSFRDPATRDPVFTQDIIDGLAHSYLNGHNPRDPDASPLYGIPERLPPIYIQVGSDEILRDDSTRYAHQAATQGADVRLDIYEDMHHVFQRDVGVLDTARVALERAASFITASWSVIPAVDRLD